MTFHDDPDLERRLRSIAETPEPPIPGSVYRYASEVTTRERGRSMRSAMNPFKATAFAAAGLAAAVVIAIAATGVLLSVRSGGAGGQTASSSATAVETAASTTAGTSPSAAPQTSGPTQTAGSSSSARPGATMMAGGFTTPGATSDWKGFMPTVVSSSSTSFPTRILRWSGGYLASAEYREFGSSNGLWTSPDGQTWTAVRGIDASQVFVSVAPGGLIAIAVGGADVPSTPRNVWKSSDGVAWHDAGASDMPPDGTLVSIAGTSAGIVAVVDVATGSGKSTVDDYRVLYSADGVYWGPVSPIGGIGGAGGLVPHVESGNGRFFLMGASGATAKRSDANAVLVASTSPHDVTLWSDDGRTWTKCGGEYTGLATKIDFGRDGLLLETNFGQIPGGTGLARSTDGGKTWVEDPNYGPLGTVECTGECTSGPDGQFSSNGTYFLAVKYDGSKAWLSYDGHTWSPVPWNLGSVQNGTILLFPRGVAAGPYGAAK